MTTTVRITVDDALYEQARLKAAAENRTVSGQLEHWARVGRAALENPDLPASFIAEALTSLGKPRSDAMPFVPRTPNQHT
jgi:uridine phosphorylase